MLSEPRKKIDAIDRKLVRLLAARYECVTEISRIKQAEGIPVTDMQREQEVVSEIKLSLTENTFETEIVQSMIAIMAISRDYQKKLMEDAD